MRSVLVRPPIPATLKPGGPESSAWQSLRELLYEAEVVGGEAADVREDSLKLRRADAEPLGEGAGVLHQSCCGDPAAVGAAVVGTAEGKGGEGAVHLAAFHRSAKDEVVRSPGVVTAIG